MIRVTIDLLPASGGPIRTLGRIDIFNDGTSCTPIRTGNYQSRFYGARGTVLNKRHGIVKDWPRLAKPIFALVARMIQEAGY